MNIYGATEDLLRYDFSKSEKLTVNLNNNFVINLEKVGCMVFFQLESTKDVRPISPPSIGTIPSDWCPFSDVYVTTTEYIPWTNYHVVAGTGFAVITSNGVVAIGYQNKDSQFRKTSGSYVVA